jgi:eukaryotic-like serine/threonine-protein kinase
MAKDEDCGEPINPAGPEQYGPYYLQELLNSGGMADIWFVTDAQGNPYALRRLRDNSLLNFTARRRFLRGCDVLSRIHNHENVIGYVEHGKIKGALYLLMEYVESSNLKQLAVRSDPVLAEHLGTILIDMAIALEHVHDSGFMHLDFKPENVLVTRNAGVRLVDFDLARIKPDKPRKMSDNPGTPAYMAPEQLLRQPIDHRADIFAFGVAAYEILTGKKPFSGETPDDILRKQLDRSIDFLPARELNPDVPYPLERCIAKCLEKDPDKRYPIASLLVHDLQTALYV